MKEKLIIRVSGCLADLTRIIGSALFPPRCLVCRCFFNPKDHETEGNAPEDLMASQGGEAFRALTASCLCRECGRGFTPVESPICLRCGRPFRNPLGSDHFCGNCLTKSGNLRTIRAAGIYEKSLKESIHLLKYRGKLQLATPLGRLLFLAFTAGGPEGGRMACDYRSIHMVIPVPLHRKKMRKRGFNQSWLLVREWRKYVEDGGIRGFPRLSPLVLKRRRWTKSQTGFGRDGRRKNVKDAFSVPDPSPVAGKRVLLVDDVYTTGATGEECARVLLKAGALSVDLLVLARAEQDYGKLE